jgi:hypothetical protein
MVAVTAGLAAGPLRGCVLAMSRLYCSSVYSGVGLRMLVPTLFTVTSARHKHVKSAWQNGEVMHRLWCRWAGARVHSVHVVAHTKCVVSHQTLA